MLRRLTLTWCMAGALTGCQSSTVDPPVALHTPAPQARAEVVPAPPPAPLPPQRHVLYVGPAPVQPAPRHPTPVVAYPPARPHSPTTAPVLPQPPAPPAEPPANYTLPPGYTSHSTLRPPAMQNPSLAQQLMAEQQQRIQANNAAIIEQTLNPYRPQYPYPQATYPQSYPQSYSPQSNPRQQAERRYLEARADFLNSKYLPAGSPPRWSADSVRGGVGTGMPLPPEMMTRNAMFDPVLQKAQQAEVLRQQMMRTPNTP